ncbi:hypothetical protein CO670_15560 [Rhizobium sp. J15]|uniref:hypothetical protein n=1 Tax=Rhizobium sp. J15 TaxID=2035450 RepID=UPI000BEAA494|nr:hypothetical protein [Rhizobium sp. J15]PDT15909.1 hypothetical protein CO670_15560 [Rhizobium sp. J15]
MVPSIWEKQGVQRVKADLAGGKYGPRRRVDVEKWLRKKEMAQQVFNFPVGVATGLAAALGLFLLLH